MRTHTKRTRPGKTELPTEQPPGDRELVEAAMAILIGDLVASGSVTVTWKTPIGEDEEGELSAFAFATCDPTLGHQIQALIDGYAGHGARDMQPDTPGKPTSEGGKNADRQNPDGTP